MMDLLVPSLFITLLGAVAAGAIILSARFLSVATDPRVDAVAEALPGVNCGACGYASCVAAAEAVVAGCAGPGVCLIGKDAVRTAIGRIMQTDSGTVVEKKAFLCCSKNMAEAGTSFTYNGPADCRIATDTFGGGKNCSGGCIGFGTCAKVCPVDALQMNNGLPLINVERCTGCGLCVQICPKKILVLTENTIAARDKKRCSEYCVNACGFTVDGEHCISCGICYKSCPVAAITWKKGTPACIDTTRCIGCLTCLRRCPKKVIS